MQRSGSRSLTSDLNLHKTSLVKESIRFGRNELGDFHDERDGIHRGAQVLCAHARPLHHVEAHHRGWPPPLGRGHDDRVALA